MEEVAREQWNRRYREGFHPSFAPDPHLLALADHLPSRGLAADIACGRGGNALWLAEQGWQVEAYDISEVALASLQQEAQRRGLQERIRTFCVDLTEASLPVRRYDLLVCTRYLQRSLFAQLRNAVRPGGLLFYATFLQTTDESKDPYRLYPNELRQIFAADSLLYYEEPTSDGMAACLVVIG
ncbi:MAG: class I SAM-dependent methyltransferase [Firmicutes bacterium]|nr:class I SAM-dependent methyltransferase [Bacillota bacterium]